MVEERERLFNDLAKTRILRPYPSRANFMLCDVVGMDGRTLLGRLADEGILVRHYGTPRLKNSIRISVGRPEQNDILVATLKKFADELGL